MAKLKGTSMSALLQEYCETNLAVDEAIHKQFSSGIFGHYTFEQVVRWPWLRSLIEDLENARTPEDHEETRERLHETLIDWRADYENNSRYGPME